MGPSFKQLNRTQIPSLNSDVTILDAYFLSKQAEIDQDLHKFEHMTSNIACIPLQGSSSQSTHPLMSHVPDMANQSSEFALLNVLAETYNTKSNPNPLPKQGIWTQFQRQVFFKNFDTDGLLAISSK